MTEMSNQDIALNLSSAGFARRCGATAFETKWDGSSHSVPKTWVPINELNTKVIDCIFARAPKEGFPINLTFETR